MTAIEKFTTNGVAIDHEAILKSLNLSPRDPKTQALLLVCDRYGLDPLLRHMVLISGNPYVTRDGYLAVAHRSGVFDGMEVLEQGADQTHYVAKVAVYRKDMSHPFTFVGRFPKNKNMAKEYGPEMAVKVAEVQALRRAFNVTGVPASDERWDVDSSEVQVAHVEPPAPAAIEPPPNVVPETGEIIDVEPEPEPAPTTTRRAAPKSRRAPAANNGTPSASATPDPSVPTDSSAGAGNEVGEMDPPVSPTSSNLSTNAKALLGTAKHTYGKTQEQLERLLAKPLTKIVTREEMHAAVQHMAADWKPLAGAEA